MKTKTKDFARESAVGAVLIAENYGFDNIMKNLRTGIIGTAERIAQVAMKFEIEHKDYKYEESEIDYETMLMAFFEQETGMI